MCYCSLNKGHTVKKRKKKEVQAATLKESTLKLMLWRRATLEVSENIWGHTTRKEFGKVGTVGTGEIARHNMLHMPEGSRLATYF